MKHNYKWGVLLLICCAFALVGGCGGPGTDPVGTAAPVSIDEPQIENTKYPTNTPNPAAQTQAAIDAVLTKGAPYQKIGWKELVDNIEAHVGEKVTIRGEVVLVENEYEFQINVEDINIAAITESPFYDLKPGEFVTLYGTVKELKCFKVGGNDVCYPIFVDAFFLED